MANGPKPAGNDEAMEKGYNRMDRDRIDDDFVDPEMRAEGLSGFRRGKGRYGRDVGGFLERWNYEDRGANKGEGYDLGGGPYAGRFRPIYDEPDDGGSGEAGMD